MILVDIGPHPSIEGRGQMVVVIMKVLEVTKVVVAMGVLVGNEVGVGNDKVGGSDEAQRVVAVVKSVIFAMG